MGPIRKVSIAFVFVAAGLMVPAETRAATITFEDVAVAPGVNSIGGDRISTGFLFDSSTNHTHLTNNTFDAYNNSTYLVTDDFEGATVLTMSKIGGGLFSLSAIDFAEWFSSERAFTVRVTGVGGVNPNLDVVLDGIFDGSGGLNDFQTVLFGPAWTNLSAVQFDAIAGLSNRYYAIDNIVVGDAAVVPEPTSLLLFSTGAAALAAARRRKKQQQVQ